MLSDPTGTDTTDFDLSFDLEQQVRAKLDCHRRTLTH